MGCGASSEEKPQQSQTQAQTNVVLAHPSQAQPQAVMVQTTAIVQPVTTKPAGNANLQSIVQKLGMPMGFYTAITPLGLKSNSSPTPIYWVMAVLANYPKILNAILKNNNGAYTATLYNAGVPTTINVEDSYPVNGNGTPFYTTTTNGDVWPLVMEKAWAQNTANGYDGLEKLDILQLWQSTTGVPCNNMGAPKGDLDSYSLWEALLEKGYPLAVVETDSNTKKILSSYTILKLHNFSGQHIVSFRDNTGIYKHNPDSNDPRQNSDADCLKQMGFPNNDPAVQWLYLEDFGPRFEDKGQVICAFYEDNWAYKYATATAQPKHPEYFELTVTKKCLWNVSAHQPLNAALTTQYSDLHVECLKKDANKIESIVDWSVDSTSPTVWYDYGTDNRYATSIEGSPAYHKGEIEPGSYIVSVRARNREMVPTNITVSVYSAKPVEIKRLEKNALGGLSGFLCRRQYIPNSSWNYMVDTDSFGYYCKVNRGFWWTKHAYVMQLVNEGQKPWNLSIKFPKMFNYKLGKPFRVGPTEFKVQVAAGASQLVYLKRVPTFDRVNDFDGDADLSENLPFKWQFVSDINE